MKMMFVVILIFTSNFLFADIPELLDSARKNHSSWKALEQSKDLSILNFKMNKLLFSPEFIIGETPIYNGGYISEYWNHSFGLSAKMNWLLPSDGILSLSASNTTNIIDSANSWNYSNSPNIILGYAQPTWLSGSFFEPSLYKKAKIYSLDKPQMEEQIKLLIESNSLVFNVIKTNLDLLVLKDKLFLLNIEIELSKKELNMLKNSRENGSISSSEYWKKQIEYDQVSNNYWLEKHKYEAGLKSFYNDYGLDNLSQIDISHALDITLPGSESDVIIYPKTTLKKIQLEKSKLQYDLGRKEYASNLTGSIGITPHYGEREDSTSFKSSFTDFETEDNYIDYNFSINFAISSKNVSNDNITRKTTILNIDLLENQFNDSLKEEKRTYETLVRNRGFLKEQIVRLKDSILYAENLYEAENKLFISGRSSQFYLEKAEYNILSIKYDLLEVQTNLFLTELEISDLSGVNLNSLF